MIFSLAEWQQCVVSEDDLPPRTGACCVGFDLGGSSSMTALSAVWPNGRVEAWGAFPGTPTTSKSGRGLTARGTSSWPRGGNCMFTQAGLLR